ncbi:hypothetical protein IAT38_005595 [Cryptococcus sp. DSM 104549]
MADTLLQDGTQPPERYTPSPAPSATPSKKGKKMKKDKKDKVKDKAAVDGGDDGEGDDTSQMMPAVPPLKNRRHFFGFRSNSTPSVLKRVPSLTPLTTPPGTAPPSTTTLVPTPAVSSTSTTRTHTPTLPRRPSTSTTASAQSSLPAPIFPAYPATLSALQYIRVLSTVAARRTIASVEAPRNGGLLSLGGGLGAGAPAGPVRRIVWQRERMVLSKFRVGGGGASGGGSGKSRARIDPPSTLAHLHVLSAASADQEETERARLVIVSGTTAGVWDGGLAGEKKSNVLCVRSVVKVGKREEKKEWAVEMNSAEELQEWIMEIKAVATLIKAEEAGHGHAVNAAYDNEAKRGDDLSLLLSLQLRKPGESAPLTSPAPAVPAARQPPAVSATAATTAAQADQAAVEDQDRPSTSPYRTSSQPSEDAPSTQLATPREPHAEIDAPHPDSAHPHTPALVPLAENEGRKSRGGLQVDVSGEGGEEDGIPARPETPDLLGMMGTLDAPAPAPTGYGYGHSDRYGYGMDYGSQRFVPKPRPTADARTLSDKAAELAYGPRGAPGYIGKVGSPRDARGRPSLRVISRRPSAPALPSPSHTATPTHAGLPTPASTAPESPAPATPETPSSASAARARPRANSAAALSYRSPTKRSAPPPPPPAPLGPPPALPLPPLPPTSPAHSHLPVPRAPSPTMGHSPTLGYFHTPPMPAGVVLPRASSAGEGEGYERGRANEVLASQGRSGSTGTSPGPGPRGVRVKPVPLLAAQPLSVVSSSVGVELVVDGVFGMGLHGGVARVTGAEGMTKVGRLNASARVEDYELEEALVAGASGRTPW